MIDIEKVVAPLEAGVEAVFEVDVTLGTVTPSAGQTEHDAWAGEIAKIVTVVDRLQKINELSLDGENGVANANAIGGFLDAASESQLLAPVVDEVVNSIVGPLLSVPIVGGMIEDLLEEEGSYTDKLVSIAELLVNFN